MDYFPLWFLYSDLRMQQRRNEINKLNKLVKLIVYRTKSNITYCNPVYGCKSFSKIENMLKGLYA